MASISFTVQALTGEHGVTAPLLLTGPSGKRQLHLLGECLIGKHQSGIIIHALAYFHQHVFAVQLRQINSTELYGNQRI
jgi:hypothetical protein